LGLLMAGEAAWTQSAAPQPSQPPTSPDQPAPQARPENPGLIHEMGKLFDKLTPSMPSPGQTLDDLNARARDAAKSTGDALSRLAKPGSVISGRTICPLANGVPDCKMAADRLCQAKGYREGSSLNTDAA